jgi:hypothetical protein
VEELERLQAEQSALGEARRLAWQVAETGVVDYARGRRHEHELLPLLRLYRAAYRAHEAACQRTGEALKRAREADREA